VLHPEFALHHSGFEQFLFAPIWEEEHGGSLTILSAFARLGIDPWGEAARLAAMPRAGAASALSSILARLPKADPEQNDPALARHLVDLLPDPASAISPRQGNSRSVDLRKAMFAVILALVAVLWALQASERLF
jgi:hypothetical protein